jgi:hypothetical protein
MMNKLTKKRSLVLLITITLVIGCLQLKSGSVQSLKAQTTADGPPTVGLGDGSVRFISSGVTATTWGQALLFCLGVKGDLIQKRDASAKLTLWVRDAKGDTLLERELIKGATPGFQCLAIPNSDIPGDREPDGLIQLGVTRHLELTGMNISETVHSVEIFDEASGEITVRHQWSWIVRVLP